MEFDKTDIEEQIKKARKLEGVAVSGIIIMGIASLIFWYAFIEWSFEYLDKTIILSGGF